MGVKIRPDQFQEVEPIKTGAKMSDGYTFRLRQHLDGNFRGLWELARLDEKGKVVRMISDADALTFCIENMQGVLEDDGL